MSHINCGRMFLGGIAAGVVVFLYEVVWSGLVLGKQWQAAMNAIQHPLPPAAAWIFPLEALGMGMSAVWIYTALRPSYGPGPGTGVRAGMAYWAIGSVVSAVSISQTGLFPVGLLAITTLGRLPELILATVAGAWLYKE